MFTEYPFGIGAAASISTLAGIVIYILAKLEIDISFKGKISNKNNGNRS